MDKFIEYKISSNTDDLDRINDLNSFDSSDIGRVIKNNTIKNDLKISLDILNRKEKIKEGYDESSLDFPLFKDTKIIVSESIEENRVNLSSVVNTLISDTNNANCIKILDRLSIFSVQNRYELIVNRGCFIYDPKIINNIVNFSCSCVVDEDIKEWTRFFRIIQQGSEEKVIEQPVEILEKSNFSSSTQDEEKEIRQNSDIFKKNNIIKYPLLVSVFHSVMSLGSNTLIRYGCVTVFGLGGSFLVLKSISCLIKNDFPINILNNSTDMYQVGKTDMFTAAKVFMKCFINYLKKCSDENN
jgi:hypothetical protein